MKYMYSILVLVALTVATPIFAQDPPPDCNATEAQMKAKQYTKEQGDICIKEWEQKVKELQDRLNALNTSIGSLNKNLTDANASLQSSNDEIAQLLNATQRQIEEFGQRLGVLEGKTRSMKGMNDAQLAEKYEDVRSLENELNKMRSEKIALYPSYFNRIIALARDIRSLYRTKPTKDYVVGTWADDRDCLWNIAGKAEIYPPCGVCVCEIDKIEMLFIDMTGYSDSSAVWLLHNNSRHTSTKLLRSWRMEKSRWKKRAPCLRSGPMNLMLMMMKN